MAFLGVRAGAGNLLLESTDVAEVLPFASCTAVPLTHPRFRGLCNVRGTLYSVLDLPMLLGYAPVTADAHARLLLLAPNRMRNTALLVNRLVGMYPAPPGDPWRVIDLDGLLALPEFLDIGVPA